MSSGVKRKRIVLSLKQKLDIINRLDKGEKVSILAAEYNVGKSSVMDIKMRKNSLLKYVSSFANTENMHRRKTMKCAYNKELDQAVYDWYLSIKARGQHVPGPVICDKALELNGALGGSSDFKASCGWLKNFKSRHGLDFSITTTDNPSAVRLDMNFPVETIVAPTSENMNINSSALTRQIPLLEKIPRIKRKRVVLSLKQKLDIIKRLDNGEAASLLAKEYNVGQSSVQDIKMRQHAILNYISSFANVDNMYRRKTMKSAYNKELDQAVYSWYVESIRAGQSVTGPIICDKALELNGLAGGSPDFKASSGWLQNFKSRHGLFFNDNLADIFSDANIYSEEMYPDIYAGDKIGDTSAHCENGYSNQSYDSFPTCDVILDVSNDSDVSDKQLSEQQEFPINIKNSLFHAFDTVLDWVKSQKECSSADVVNLEKLRGLAHAKEMSVAFSSDDSETINRKIYNPIDEKRDESLSLEDMYEIGRCVEWITSNNFSKVALQFPDSMLNDATVVALKLGDLTDKQMFVLGDTSYGSCCVDEIASEHVTADAIIHFGHACLSSSKRLPVLYIFGKQVINIQDVTEAFRRLFLDKTAPVVFLYEVMYSYAIDVISEILKEYENLVVSRLEIPGEETKCFNDPEINENLMTIIKCHRHILIPANHSLNNYSIFYVGSRAVTLTNFMLSLKNCHFYTYNPLLKLARAETIDVNKHLKRRYYYIEKAKDAKIIGILVGTLGVSNYLTMIKHLKDLIKQAGKKSYTLVVGKLNSAKLANFAEIEIFVNVACIESTLIESREFYQSIITPFELEIALNQARNWTGDYIADFSEILPGAVHYISPCHQKEMESDVSLVTGKIRHTGLSLSTDYENAPNTALVTRSDMKVSSIHSQGAGEFLVQRSWQGLEQCLGETSVPEVEEGQRGIASKYEDEKTDKCS